MKSVEKITSLNKSDHVKPHFIPHENKVHLSAIRSENQGPQFNLHFVTFLHLPRYKGAASAALQPNETLSGAFHAGYLATDMTIECFIGFSWEEEAEARVLKLSTCSWLVGHP